ncbi:MAG: L-serine ammonia-lyase, iron-sulfur-dependent, subunit alpha [Candidatus Onthovivens sp.]|nr:L-serine ammonia-lyase, iron-sulfur-dependent, subunit alpha [Candidatus Onthovivens sp.]
MKSISDVYIVGNGPSSSHTMGPSFALEYVFYKYPNIDSIKIILYGSLALTGKGHLTDKVLENKLKLKNINYDIQFDTVTKVKHPNTMDFIISTPNGIKNERILSTGGGSIRVLSKKREKQQEVYDEHYLSSILKICNERKITLYEYVKAHESYKVMDYLEVVYETMTSSIKRGVSCDGILPGPLHVQRKAKNMLSTNIPMFDDISRAVCAASFAASEENASGGIVVTSPTCGSCGVLPGVLTYLHLKGIAKEKIIEGLAVAGLIGIIIKTNASVSGAVGGCQAEIGAACAMGSAMIMHALGYDNDKIAQASEIALEHSLGLTCDPIKGYVQIPCIERNASFALKSIDSALIASITGKHTNKITFDAIVRTMYETGKDMNKGYKETSKKGMSKIECF